MVLCPRSRNAKAFIDGLARLLDDIKNELERIEQELRDIAKESEKRRREETTEHTET